MTVRPSRSRLPGRELRATDDGAGVSEDEVPRLFERFYRADRARSSRGTGLGLAIVKHIVTSAEGTIDAHSSMGAGPHDRLSVPALTRSTPDGHHPSTPGRLELRNNRRDACARRFLVLLAILAAGCGRERPSDAAPTTTQSEEEAIGGFEEEALSGRIEADGSSTVAPLVTLAAERFRKQEPG